MQFQSYTLIIKKALDKNASNYHKDMSASKIFLLYTSRAQKAKIMYMGQLYQGDKKQHLCIRDCFGKCNRRFTTPVSLPPGKSIIKKELDDSTS